MVADRLYSQIMVMDKIMMHTMMNMLMKIIQGVFFNWPKKIKYVKSRLGVSTLT